MGMRNRERGDWFPETVTLRKGSERDLTYVKDIDLKSSQYPWSHNAWGLLEGTQCKLHLAIDRGEPVGFVVYWAENGDVEVMRLGVKPAYQHNGIGTGLMDFVKEFARTEKYPQVKITIAEILCSPGDPDDVSEWLAMQGFYSEPPIVKEYARMYGEWVDGFRFVYVLGAKDGTTV